MNAADARRLIALVREFAPDGPSRRNPAFTNAQSADIHEAAIAKLAPNAMVPEYFDREYGHLVHLLPVIA